MTVPASELFQRIKNAHKNTQAKVCIDVAEREYATGLETASSEARQWVKLALEYEKDDLARQLAELQEKFGEKSKNREAADKLRNRKRAVGDNVVPIVRDDI